MTSNDDVLDHQALSVTGGDETPGDDVPWWLLPTLILAFLLAMAIWPDDVLPQWWKDATLPLRRLVRRNRFRGWY